MPLDSVLAGDVTTQVERVLQTLSDKEAQILRLRFGVGEDAELTLEEVGRRFGVTRERIRQIQARALDKLRSPSHREVLQDLVGALAAHRARRPRRPRSCRFDRGCPLR